MTVYIDPACNVNYCSFYIKGLRSLFGSNNVVFTSKGFHGLRYTFDSHCIAFIIDKKKYVIDCADSNTLFFNCFLEWADFYGKVNYSSEYIPVKFKRKIKHVGPNFGMAIFGRNKWEALLKCIPNYLKSRSRLDVSFGTFLSPYLWLYKRYGIQWGTAKSKVSSNSIFMISRYWKGQPWVNDARVNFIRACKRLQQEGLIKFNGGMVPDAPDTDCPKDVLLENEIPMVEYMRHLDESLLVFNTPAYHHCHGWKLPEYLSQGKIILSTPFVNELPEPMTHGENIYFTQPDENSIYNSIKLILDDYSLQRRLEIGSNRYWIEYASPEACVRNFINEKK